MANKEGIVSVMDGGGFYGVGSDNVVEIKQHSAQGEGDRWYYDVHYEDGGMLRLFAPLQVRFAPPEMTEDEIPS